MTSPYVVEGQPTIEVDQEYFKAIQNDSEFLEVLNELGVEYWDQYEQAKLMHKVNKDYA
jgi:hypothetical protein